MKKYIALILAFVLTISVTVSWPCTLPPRSAGSKP